MRILLVGLVLTVAWVSTIAIPILNDVDSKAVWFDKYAENNDIVAKAFLSGILNDYKKY